jgi:S1-C subfamily serine protease
MRHVAGRHTRSAVLVALAVATTAQLAFATGCGPAPLEPAAAVVRVEVEACGGHHRQRATAVVLGDGVAATAAHTFDSAASFEVADDRGRPLEAEIVWLDTERDVALLQLDDPPVAWLPLGDEADGAPVRVVTAAADGDPVEKPASIVRHVTATLDGEGSRAALELDADIEPGDSGAPVIGGDGQVVGIVFAASRNGGHAWAVAAEEIEAALASRASEGLRLRCP